MNGYYLNLFVLKKGDSHSLQLMSFTNLSELLLCFTRAPNTVLHTESACWVAGFTDAIIV